SRSCGESVDAGDQSSVAAGLLLACLFAAAFAGCASPSSSGPRDAGASGPPVVSAPRFDSGGPDAEEYGASNGYPIGARGTSSPLWPRAPASLPRRHAKEKPSTSKFSHLMLPAKTH